MCLIIFLVVPGEPAEALTGTFVVSTTVRFMMHLRIVCPLFDRYIQRNRERCLGEFAGLVFASAIATMRKWR
ncbi:MAG: hypothetical protein P4L40_05330, partial [Terracidiphilus sp.]|nr:hypothetical protein [Terracidiphilus sp.]